MENSTNHDPEVVAIGSIMKALDLLEDTRKRAVLDFVSHRIGGVVVPLQASEQKNDQVSISGDEDIKTFLKTKDTQNKYQQVAVLAYYLIKKKGQEAVNKEMIEAANKEAGGRTIDDITGTLNDAKTKYEFFGTGSGGKKILLAYGEDVVEALPNQEKVKELAKKKPSRKRRSKPATKKVPKK